MNLKEGGIYIIDADFANGGGEVILVKIYGKHFCRVKDPDSGEEWDTMLNRLTAVQVSDTTKDKSMDELM